jgi:peptidoglycan hydrolase-like protein with peptidoglycan-binding domain
MNLRIFLAASLTLLTPLGALAGDSLTSLHPEEALPDNAPPLASPGPYTEFTKQVQERLHEQGFDAGPVNGDFGSKTQAALAQFQLSRALPAGGQLDEQTLAELGVERGAQAVEAGGNSSSGASAPASDTPASDK